VRGEQGASRVPSRPAAMRQLARHGDEAAAVLVRHPGVAEPLLERCGAQAVQALLANPEPFLNVPRDLAAAAGDGVVEPVVVGITNVLLGTWAVVAVLIAAAAVVAREHGLPGPEAVKSVAAVFRK
ncbi:MAG: hypothetical protein K2X87_19745, partial [Gemmataceae bacterium]|nr:hypothetical protein [Gemmataceae bacterium]